MTNPIDDRELFNPNAFRHLPCIVCYGRSACVGVFYPSTDEARAAVLLLRQGPLRPDREPALGYGLCAEHQQLPVEQIEDVILGLARRVRVQ